MVLITLAIFEDEDAMELLKLTSGPRQRHINRSLNVPRGDNQFYSREKEEQEGGKRDDAKDRA